MKPVRSLTNRRESPAKKPWSQAKLAYALIIPTLIVIFALVLYPIVKSFYLSSFQVELANPFPGRPFVGLQNYVDIFTDSYFWSSLSKTLYFTFVSIGLELILGMAVALLLNTDFRGRGFLRALILIPWALPITVDGIMWKWIFNANYGALNSLLFQLGITDQYRTWLSEPFMALNMVIIADVWKVTPLVTLLLLASLQTIPSSLYEAVEIDGAGIWRKFRYITWPLILPTVLIVLILRTLDAFKVFDLIYVMTQGGPANGTMVLSYYAYLEAFKYLNFGTGSAAAYIITIFIGLIAFSYTKLIKRDIEY